MVTEKRDGSVRGLREDGTNASFPQERIERVYSPVYRLREEEIERGFEEIRERGRELAIPEPRLRDAYAEETDALKVLDDTIENLLPPHLRGAERQRCTEMLWSLETAEDYERLARRIESLREEVWQPFEQREGARSVWLSRVRSGKSDGARTLVGRSAHRSTVACRRGARKRALQLARAETTRRNHGRAHADEDRDYGELELEDDIVTSLSRFEDIGFKVSAEEWKHSVDPAPDLNFSAAGAAVHWANGAPWSQIVKETRAEEGDLFRMFSRTGEALPAGGRSAPQPSASGGNGGGGRGNGVARSHQVSAESATTITRISYQRI